MQIYAFFRERATVHLRARKAACRCKCGVWNYSKELRGFRGFRELRDLKDFRDFKDLRDLR